MNVCVVTVGGSSIGKNLVEAFGKDVVTVITGRSEAKLKKCRMS